MTNRESIKKRFEGGLRSHGLTLEDFERNWKYAGGDEGRHHNYWCLRYGRDKEKPPHADSCLCGHPIKENCYVSDGNEFLVLGNCCIKRFVPVSGRSCEKCNGPHRNRKRNLCNACIEKECTICKQECNPRYKMCYECKYGKGNYSKGLCFYCKTKIDPSYRQCFPCLQKLSS